MSGAAWVRVALAAYVLGFALHWPRVLLIVDEDRYVSQAVALARGELAMTDRGVLYPAVATRTLSDYPPGTSLLQVPFVRAGGWRAAALASVLALVVATLATMAWLRASRGPPADAFALFIPAFAGTAFFGRVAMSDVPATALVALTGWLLWTAHRASVGRSLLAGFCAGSILLFREPVIVLVVPLLAGALLRRACSWWAVPGFAAAVGLRLVLAGLFFGSPWYMRDPGIGFALTSLSHSLPLYALILLVLLPGAALLPLLYRGTRRPEVVLGVSVYVLLFLLYDYDSIAMNGPVKGVILAARYMAPAVPLFALMASDVWPRWHARLAARVPGRVALTVAGVVATVAAFAIHPIARRQEADGLRVRDVLMANTSAEVPVVTNTDATLKYFSPVYGARRLIVRHRLRPDSLAALTRRHGALTIALLDRRDSPAFRADADDNARFLVVAAGACTVVPTHETPMGVLRVHVYRVSNCR